MHLASIWMVVLCATVPIALQLAYANPVYSQTSENYRPIIEVEDPEAMLELLARLGQTILRARHEGTNSKRGLDLGLGRGFSGSQAAKHIMGLAAANFASGPGKRKRNEMALDYPVASQQGLGMDASELSASGMPIDYYLKS